MGTFIDKQVPLDGRPQALVPDDVPDRVTVHEDTVHPSKTTGPATVPLGATVDSTGVVHVGATNT